MRRWSLRRRATVGLLSSFVLHVIPLPAVLGWFRPSFAVIAVLYWSIAAPGWGGVGLGFLMGLALDAYLGVVLGQHALATALVAYIAIRQHLIIRNKSMFEQTFYIAGLLLLWKIVVWIIDGWTGHALGSWTRLLPIVTGTLLWPFAWEWLGGDLSRSRR
jgi:rod shape-determining protein MreD